MATPEAARTAPNSDETPRPRGVSRFLFRTPLGWFTCVVALLLALVLLAPTIASGMIASRGAAAFDERYQGKLVIGEASLSWFGEQSVRDVRLLDPSGGEVARVGATLPSLWSLATGGGRKLGTIVVDARADLAADDAGTTNLQRALAPRETKPRDDAPSKDDGKGTDVAELVRELDVDLRVNLERVSWSDADTRRLGRPFEIQGGVVTVVAKPGRPVVAHVGGNVAGERPGTLEIDARIHGPIDPSARWPFGRTEAEGRIEGFSTALVDGLTRLGGDLVEVVGPTFALRFDATVESAERGAAQLVLDGTSADVALNAKLEDGAITTGGEPLLVATAPMPRGLLERVLLGKLPPDARVTFADAGKPWSIRIPRARVPLPDPSARDLAAMRPALEKAELDVEIDLPGAATIETDALRAAKITAGVSAMRAGARAAPGQPLAVTFDAALEAGAPGRVHVEATVADPFALIAGGAIPPIDLNASVEGLSTLALGEFAGQGARVASALGPVANVTIEARRANLDGGDVRVLVKSAQLDANVAARVAQGALTIDATAPAAVTWNATPEFVAAEIGPRLPAGASLAISGPLAVSIPALSAPLRDASGAFAGKDALLAGTTARVDVRLPDVAWSSASASADPANPAPASPAPAPDVRASLRGALVTFEVAAGAPPVVKVGADVLLAGDAQAPGRLQVDVRPSANLAALAAGGVPPAAVALELRDLDTAALERVAGQPGQLVPLLGPKLALTANVEGAMPESGTLAASVTGALGRASLAGRVADGRFTATGDGVTATAQVTNELLRARIGPSLPAGARVELAGEGASAITVAVRDLSTPIEAADVAQRIAGTTAKLEVALPAIAYADAKTDAAGRAAVLRDAKLSASIAPGEKPALRFAAQVEDATPGELSVELTALDDVVKLSGEGAWKTFRAGARVRAANVPTALVDALAGQDGLLVEALGPRILVEVQAPDLAYDRGTIDARVESGQNVVKVAARLDAGTFVVDRTDGLDVDVALGPLLMDRVVGRLLPMLRKASFLAPVAESELVASTQFAPFLLNSSDVRFALDGDVSKLNGVFAIDLGTLSFRGLPMLEELGITLDAVDVRLPAFTVPIKDGVAHYTKLPIRLGGRDVLFDGTVRLTDGEMSLATKLPLAMLGKKFDRELAKIRDFVPADTAIPIELRGTWNKPRVGFQDGFLQKLIQDAAGKAAEGKIDDLLDGLLGGKKKKGG